MAKDKAKAKGKASKEKESKKPKKAVAAEEAPKKKGFPAKKGAFGRPAGAGGPSKPKAKKKPLPVFKAPDEFKPFFAKVMLKIAKDGIIDDVQMIRIKGSPTNENAKTVDMSLLDPDTLRRFAARYCAVAFIKSDKKRLPGNSIAQLLLRIGYKKDSGQLTTSCKSIKFKEGKDGKAKMLDKKDPKYRALRKPMRLIPGAFTKVGQFPSAADLKALLKNQESDE
jgi:hypothetical protein